MKINVNKTEKFENRHHGKDEAQVNEMLQIVQANSLDELIEQTVPANIRLSKPLELPTAQGEYEFLKSFKKLAQKNKIFKSYIGLGYYECITPPVILRNILENPGWYTAYSPYQAEIAQGRLEAVINFQTTIIDLTQMEIANASLLDEATAAAEAMHLLFAVKSKAKKDANKFFVSELCFPQTIDLLKTRTTPIGVELVIGNHLQIDITDPSLFGVLLQYPAKDGEVIDYTNFIAAAHEQDVKIVVAADLLSLTVLKAPGEMGADIVVGSAQRFGVPMGYGGPHAAFFATKEEFKRQVPGRIIGLSKDAQGNNAYRMALQTREQHIRREKATSNICTAQVLLAVMAGAYSVYHGAGGLKNIAEKIYGLTQLLANGLEVLGAKVENSTHFDTLKIVVESEEMQHNIQKLATLQEINLRYEANHVICISLNETTTVEDISQILEIFAIALQKKVINIHEFVQNVENKIPENLQRKSAYLTHPVFNKYHTEHEMLRYLKYLENKDISLAHSMIALGSCTMKLNATTEMIPVTWAEFGNMHPFAPKEQTAGYQELFKNLEKWLCEVTGFAGISLQPNSGAQGEYAGLMVIRAFHIANGDKHRNVALIPSSAHGTNPASAVMAGMKVIVTKCDENGNVDLDDLRAKAVEHKDDLACLMVTYPSTHGVFEEAITEICQLIHENGGLVYMDGANMNAQVGLTSPANIGADVCHLNLHKTFCIPHGGGGPGMGPIGVVAKLVPFLPAHPLVEVGGNHGITPVSAAPYGSASILTISYAYIVMMGGDGLTNATKIAILNANYIKDRLKSHYPILYIGKNGRCAHEMIVDCRQFKQSAGVEVEDIAKRLMDYGFHAPTVSFPVAGTLMIEPTESETKAELDRFCDAMIQIRKEIKEIEDGLFDKTDNILKHAPHTQNIVINDAWNKPYSREKAAYPLPYLRHNKVWASVSRIDSAFGDRNLVCSCAPIEEYAGKEVEMA